MFEQRPTPEKPEKLQEFELYFPLRVSVVPSLDPWPLALVLDIIAPGGAKVSASHEQVRLFSAN
jgi:hypothetical protein